MALVGVGGCLLARDGDMGVCIRWVLASNGGMGARWPEMETCVWAGWALVISGDMGACWPEMETGVCVRWVLVSNGAMGVC